MLGITEMFVTISGEAPIQGFPVYLIRFSGCNLDCTYCDTPYNDEVSFTWSSGVLVQNIREQLSLHPDLRILLTGGEPLLAERKNDIKYVMENLEEIDFYLETNGSQFLSGLLLKNCHMVVDWKTPSSGHPDSFYLENLEIMRPEKDCIKFVVNAADLGWVEEKIRMINEKNNGLPVWLSPQWDNLDPRIIAEFILDKNLPARLSLQLHKIIWGAGKRGV
ncbi:MAG: 4Fe-4S cluster-binding domain-containing protein [Spirochaetales bacterium]|nr:4Fe-4S cluster-binding domain-containing protein [Spirochaetales bacterium]